MPDTSSASRRILVADAVCDFDQLTLEVDGDVTRLEPRLAGVLAVLVQHAGETLSRDELLSLAWEADASDEALTQAISRLRKLLGDRKVIETIPRVGYRVTAAVTPAPAAVHMLKPTPAVPPGSEGRRPPHAGAGWGAPHCWSRRRRSAASWRYGCLAERGPSSGSLKSSRPRSERSSSSPRMRRSRRRTRQPRLRTLTAGISGASSLCTPRAAEPTGLRTFVAPKGVDS